MGLINVFRRMLAISGLPLSLFTAQPAASQYPDRPVSLILPTPPSGAADLNARPLAKHLLEVLKQPVVVVNRQGAGGAIAYGSVAKAPPDGYNLLLALSTVSVLPEADRINGCAPAYELEQLTPIAMISADPLMLIVPAATPAPIVEALRAAVRKVVALPGYREDKEKVRIPINYMDGPEFAAFWKKDAEAMVSQARKIAKVQ
jgi:tripartite-type tricarboxylate transporter receptor subunit TctC